MPNGTVHEPRQRTTMRLRKTVNKALDREVRKQGAESRTQLVEAILTNYLIEKGYKLAKPWTLS